MYCTTAQMQNLIDNRLIGDLLDDTGQRVGQVNQLTNQVLIQALSTAAGQINASALIGERYTVLELNALTGDDANFLVIINAWLAFGLLCSRRGRSAEEHSEYVQAVEMLGELRKGNEIFNVPGDVGVGVGQATFPSIQDMKQVNSLRFQTFGYFPERVPQYPPAPGT